MLLNGKEEEEEKEDGNSHRFEHDSHNLISNIFENDIAGVFGAVIIWL